jgi:signal transduction histidine kinase
VFRSTSLRLAALYTGAFALAVAVLGLVTILATRAALAEQFDDRVRSELAAVKDDYLEGGVRGLIGEISERAGNPGEIYLGAQTSGGAPLGGALKGLHPASGWSVTNARIGGRTMTLRVLTEILPGGYRLMAGDDVSRVQTLDRSVVWGFSLAFIAVIVIGAAGGFALSRSVHRRLSAISGTAEAIIDGDLGRRIPVGKGEDDLSRLAATINRMLERIGGLMDSLRQVSSDVAHDLRTPLTRLRQRLELSLTRAKDPEHRAQIEGALRDVDAILATFAALLRIAEVEAGARRTAFRALDLAALTQAACDDYAPAAEDAGKRLTVRCTGPAWVDGDRDLLNQMLVNLIENALTHTPAGTHIAISAGDTVEGPSLSVRDDGPGVPAGERERLFDRFYRLEISRSTPGSGLGLALVAAVARLHRAEIRLADADPGLEVRVAFPRLSPAL